MATLPNQRRIFVSDFDEENQELVNQLSIPINTNIEFLYQTLNKNVSLKDNIYAEVKEFTTSVDANGTPIDTLKFQSVLNTAILGMQVLKARHSTGASVFPSATPFISFSQSGKTITINNIAGLPVGQSFVITLVAYGS